VLSHHERRGIPKMLREVDPGKSETCSFSGMQKVHRMRKEIGLPSADRITWHAGRHGA
jgi:hypothetical protein